MSSFLCFICHSTVNSDTNEDTREKYRDVVGMNLCPDSHLCYICCHVLHKLSLFKSVCLKRSLEYPVLFSEKGTLNLQRNDTAIHTLCPEDTCTHYHQRFLTKSYHPHFNYHETHHDTIDNQYVELEDERTEARKFNVKEILDKWTQTDNVLIESYTQTDLIDNDENINDNQVENDDNTNDDNDNTGIIDDNEVGFDQLSGDNDNYDENEADINYDDYSDCKSDDEIFEEKHDNDRENNDHSTNDKKSEMITDNEKSKYKSRFTKIVLTLEQQKAELEARRKEKKYVEAEFKCYNCALGFLFKDTYQAHMMRHEESNGEYRCSTCTLRFCSASVLRAHVAGHGARYVCACGAGVRRAARAPHAQACGGRRVACHVCARLYPNNNALQQHLKRFHESKNSKKMYSCNICGSRYNNQAAVRTHMIKHINRKFACDQCPSIFTSPYTLTQHKKKHTAIETRHYCEICQVGYASSKSLLAHWRTAAAHQRPAECEICHRLYPQRSLASHMQRVHSTQDHHCHKCSKSYTSRKSLLRHLREQHEGRGVVKMAVCHLCGASFKGNNKLNRHLKSVCEKAKFEEELNSLYQQQ